MKYLKSPTRAGIDLGRDRRLERLTAAGWVFGSFSSRRRVAGSVPQTWLVVGRRDGQLVQGTGSDEAEAWSRAIAAAGRLDAGRTPAG